MKSTEIKHLITELFSAHPEFKKHEKELIQYLMKFIEHRPETAINETFKKSLREKLLVKCHELDTHKKPTPPIFWKHFGLFIGGVSFAGLLVLPWIYNEIPFSKNIPTAPEIKITAEGIPTVATEDQGQNAFGELTFSSDAVVPAGRGGGEMMYDSKMSSMIMPPFPGGERVNIKYKYAGKLPELSEFVSVYKKKTASQQNPLFNIKSFDFATVARVMNLESLKDIKLQNVSLVEDREKGYVINLDLQTPAVSIFENYEKWQPYLPACTGFSCTIPEMKKEDMPSDATILKMATDFIKKYGIDTTFLSAPEIEKQWLQAEVRGERPFYPDVVNVRYAFELEGKKVEDSWGNTLGLMVNVNVRNKYVTGAYISPLILDKSEYKTVSQETILSSVEKGGFTGMQYVNPDRTEEKELENPEIKFVAISKNAGLAGKAPEEYIIPAIIFTVKKTKEMPQYYFYTPEKIIVPLAENVFIK